MRRNPAGSGKLRQWVRWTEGLKVPACCTPHAWLKRARDPIPEGSLGPSAAQRSLLKPRKSKCKSGET